MKYFLSLITLFCLHLSLFAQTRGFGYIDTAELKLTSCEFEKDANAEVLVDYCKLKYDAQTQTFTIEHYKRLKIFNANASSGLGDVSLKIPNYSEVYDLSDLKAETINLNNGKIEISRLDKKSFYKQKVDKWISRITFSFPAIRNGSILEYTYKETIDHLVFLPKIPDWYFQGDLPVKSSECDVKLPKGYTFLHKLYTKQELTTNSDSVVLMTNVPSLQEEPFMNSYLDNLEHISFVVTSYDGSGKTFNTHDTWQDIGASFVFKESYGQQLKIKLKGEELLVNAVKNMAPEQKMAYLFKKIRDTLTCDDDKSYPYDNLGKAWNRKKCSTEQINMILCRFLQLGGLNANLVLVSNDSDEPILPSDPSFKNLDETVVHVQIDSNKYYVLDASEKNNRWDQIPYELLNTYGLYMNVQNPAAGLVFIEDKNKVRSVVYTNAEISADGKMKGATQISNAGYNRIKTIKKYKEDGETKYTEELREKDNNVKISSFKIENMEVDTLPLLQNIDFVVDLPGSDDDYIFINPLLFSNIRKNPFINSERISDIDFGYRNNHSIHGRYKIPDGYKVDALPKNITMTMPDGSIRLKQVASVEDGIISLHYTIDYNRSYFKKEEYPALYDFYKKMYEMLSQQIVLKKS
ncbi:MAG TPA: DUF3857 domain-containing protein [Mucilaginibacter sp.]|nr:DUF3857 domain-containing protein [Mucilaginibacter sp.]